MTINAEWRTGVSAERLRWSVDLGGRSHALDLLPAAFGRSVGVEVDGRPVGRIPKPTPQQPWREAALPIEGERVLVGLTWHFPVMRADVFVHGRSLLNGRPLEVSRADAPAAPTNYEVWIGGLFRMPFVGLRPHPPRSWPLVILACAAVWITGLVASPLPPAFRVIAAVALFATGVVLVLGWVWSLFAISRRAHLALLARPQLGDARRLLAWWAAFVGHAIVPILVSTLLVLLAR
jgi:hypothetical protein